MELIYTKRDTGFEAGKNYRNPTYFDRIEKATSVVLDGDFPAVRAAYEDAGVPVTEIDPAERQDGPTVAEYVAAGYHAVNYPPKGYASRSTDDEIAEAIAAQAGEPKPIDKLKVDELKALLTEKGIEIPEGAKKDDLVALLTPAE